MYMFKQLNFDRKAARRDNRPSCGANEPVHCTKRAPTAMVGALFGARGQVTLHHDGGGYPPRVAFQAKLSCLNIYIIPQNITALMQNR